MCFGKTPLPWESRLCLFYHRPTHQVASQLFHEWTVSGNSPSDHVTKTKPCSGVDVGTEYIPKVPKKASGKKPKPWVIKEDEEDDLLLEDLKVGLQASIDLLQSTRRSRRQRKRTTATPPIPTLRLTRRTAAWFSAEVLPLSLTKPEVITTPSEEVLGGEILPETNAPPIPDKAPPLTEETAETCAVIAPGTSAEQRKPSPGLPEREHETSTQLPLVSPIPAQKKRGRGRPRKIFPTLSQEISSAAPLPPSILILPEGTEVTACQEPIKCESKKLDHHTETLSIPPPKRQKRGRQKKVKSPVVKKLLSDSELPIVSSLNPVIVSSPDLPVLSTSDSALLSPDLPVTLDVTRPAQIPAHQSFTTEGALLQTIGVKRRRGRPKKKQSQSPNISNPQPSKDTKDLLQPICSPRRKKSHKDVKHGLGHEGDIHNKVSSIRKTSCHTEHEEFSLKDSPMNSTSCEKVTDAKAVDVAASKDTLAVQNSLSCGFQASKESVIAGSAHAKAESVPSECQDLSVADVTALPGPQSTNIQQSGQPSEDTSLVISTKETEPESDASHGQSIALSSENRVTSTSPIVHPQIDEVNGALQNSTVQQSPECHVPSEGTSALCLPTPTNHCHASNVIDSVIQEESLESSPQLIEAGNKIPDCLKSTLAQNSRDQDIVKVSVHKKDENIKNEASQQLSKNPTATFSYAQGHTCSPNLASSSNGHQEKDSSQSQPTCDQVDNTKNESQIVKPHTLEVGVATMLTEHKESVVMKDNYCGKVSLEEASGFTREESLSLKDSTPKMDAPTQPRIEGTMSPTQTDLSNTNLAVLSDDLFDGLEHVELKHIEMPHEKAASKVTEAIEDPLLKASKSIGEIIDELEQAGQAVKQGRMNSTNLLDNVQACSKYVSDTMNMCSSNPPEQDAPTKGSIEPPTDRVPQCKPSLVGFQMEIKKQVEHKLPQQSPVSSTAGFSPMMHGVSQRQQATAQGNNSTFQGSNAMYPSAPQHGYSQNTQSYQQQAMPMADQQIGSSVRNMPHSFGNHSGHVSYGHMTGALQDSHDALSTLPLHHSYTHTERPSAENIMPHPNTLSSITQAGSVQNPVLSSSLPLPQLPGVQSPSLFAGPNASSIQPIPSNVSADMHRHHQQASSIRGHHGPAGPQPNTWTLASNNTTPLHSAGMKHVPTSRDAHVVGFNGSDPSTLRPREPTLMNKPTTNVSRHLIGLPGSDLASYRPSFMPTPSQPPRTFGASGMYPGHQHSPRPPLHPRTPNSGFTHQSGLSQNPQVPMSSSAMHTPSMSFGHHTSVHAGQQLPLPGPEQRTPAKQSPLTQKLQSVDSGAPKASPRGMLSPGGTSGSETASVDLPPDENPLGGTPVTGNTPGGMPPVRLPSDGNSPGDSFLKGDTPGGTPPDGIPPGLPPVSLPSDGKSSGEIPLKENTPSGKYPHGISAGMPTVGMPSDGKSPGGMPLGGNIPSGILDGMPPVTMPSDGKPSNEIPLRGNPPGGIPPHEIPVGMLPISKPSDGKSLGRIPLRENTPSGMPTHGIPVGMPPISMSSDEKYPGESPLRENTPSGMLPYGIPGRIPSTAMSSEGNSASGIPLSGNTPGGMPPHGIPGGISPIGMPSDGMALGGIPLRENTSGGIPPHGILGGIPPIGMPSEGKSPGGIPLRESTSGGMAPHGIPGGIPLVGMPPCGMSPNTIPKHGSPPHEKPSSGMTSSGISPAEMHDYGVPLDQLPFSVDNDDGQELLDRLQSNITEDITRCNCPGTARDEMIEGPYYTHLGAAKDLPAIRSLMEKRSGLIGKAIRIEKLVYTGKEGKGSQGCPIAKWIIRRSGPEEKLLVIVRPRPGHVCETAVLVVNFVYWEGVPEKRATQLYDFLVQNVATKAYETERRCGTNDQRTCMCQGLDGHSAGASFSFGCSWSMYYNGCKFARSGIHPRKFKLKEEELEPTLETHLQNLADELGPLYKGIAPDSFRNMTAYESVAEGCRLGTKPGRPFSGVTTCMDFCAHSHKDLHNMNNGCTMVVTLTKHRGFGPREDEQLHVLPLYTLDSTDEFGSAEAQERKMQEGSVEFLTSYKQNLHIMSIPRLSKKKRQLQKAGRGSPAKRGRKPKLAGRGMGSPKGGSTPDSSPYKLPGMSYSPQRLPRHSVPGISTLFWPTRAKMRGVNTGFHGNQGWGSKPDIAESGYKTPTQYGSNLSLGQTGVQKGRLPSYAEAFKYKMKAKDNGYSILKVANEKYQDPMNPVNKYHGHQQNPHHRQFMQNRPIFNPQYRGTQIKSEFAAQQSVKPHQPQSKDTNSTYPQTQVQKQEQQLAQYKQQAIQQHQTGQPQQQVGQQHQTGQPQEHHGQQHHGQQQQSLQQQQNVGQQHTVQQEQHQAGLSQQEQAGHQQPLQKETETPQPSVQQHQPGQLQSSLQPQPSMQQPPLHQQKQSSEQSMHQECVQRLQHTLQQHTEHSVQGQLQHQVMQQGQLKQPQMQQGQIQQQEQPQQPPQQQQMQQGQPQQQQIQQGQPQQQQMQQEQPQHQQIQQGQAQQQQSSEQQHSVQQKQPGQHARQYPQTTQLQRSLQEQPNQQTRVPIKQPERELTMHEQQELQQQKMRMHQQQQRQLMQLRQQQHKEKLRQQKLQRQQQRRLQKQQQKQQTPQQQMQQEIQVQIEPQITSHQRIQEGQAQQQQIDQGQSQQQIQLEKMQQQQQIQEEKVQQQNQQDQQQQSLPQPQQMQPTPKESQQSQKGKTQTELTVQEHISAIAKQLEQSAATEASKVSKTNPLTKQHQKGESVGSTHLSMHQTLTQPSPCSQANNEPSLTQKSKMEHQPPAYHQSAVPQHVAQYPTGPHQSHGSQHMQQQQHMEKQQQQQQVQQYQDQFNQNQMNGMGDPQQQTALPSIQSWQQPNMTQPGSVGQPHQAQTRFQQQFQQQSLHQQQQHMSPQHPQMHQQQIQQQNMYPNNQRMLQNQSLQNNGQYLQQHSPYGWHQQSPYGPSTPNTPSRPGSVLSTTSHHSSNPEIHRASPFPAQLDGPSTPPPSEIEMDIDGLSFLPVQLDGPVTPPPNTSPARAQAQYQAGYSHNQAQSSHYNMPNNANNMHNHVNNMQNQVNYMSNHVNFMHNNGSRMMHTQGGLTPPSHMNPMHNYNQMISNLNPMQPGLNQHYPMHPVNNRFPGYQMMPTDLSKKNHQPPSYNQQNYGLPRPLMSSMPNGIPAPVPSIRALTPPVSTSEMADKINASPDKKPNVEKEPENIIKEVFTDNSHLFEDAQVGGVGIALAHGAVLFECAKRELHATTAMQRPNRYKPTRIALVFYQHKHLNLKNHGAEEFEKKAAIWRKKREARRAERLANQQIMMEAEMRMLASQESFPFEMYNGFELDSFPFDHLGTPEKMLSSEENSPMKGTPPKPCLNIHLNQPQTPKKMVSLTENSLLPGVLANPGSYQSPAKTNNILAPEASTPNVNVMGPVMLKQESSENRMDVDKQAAQPMEIEPLQGIETKTNKPDVENKAQINETGNDSKAPVELKDLASVARSPEVNFSANAPPPVQDKQQKAMHALDTSTHIVKKENEAANNRNQSGSQGSEVNANVPPGIQSAIQGQQEVQQEQPQQKLQGQTQQHSMQHHGSGIPEAKHYGTPRPSFQHLQDPQSNCQQEFQKFQQERQQQEQQQQRQQQQKQQQQEQQQQEQQHQSYPHGTSAPGFRQNNQPMDNSGRAFQQACQMSGFHQGNAVSPFINHQQKPMLGVSESEPFDGQMNPHHQQATPHPGQTPDQFPPNHHVYPAGSHMQPLPPGSDGHQYPPMQQQAWQQNGFSGHHPINPDQMPSDFQCNWGISSHNYASAPTTQTVTTKWIKPQSVITGPYQRYM